MKLEIKWENKFNKPTNGNISYIDELINDEEYFNASKEIENAKNALKILGGEIEKIDKIILPESDIERNIITVIKVKQTPLKYPRKPGTPQKSPIR